MVMNAGKNKGVKANDTPTPIEVVEYITKLVEPCLRITPMDDRPKRVLDPACGSGILTSKLTDVEVVQYDIIIGKDFFSADKEEDIDCVIVNPPFNRDGVGQGRKLLPEAFLDKILEVCDKNTPIILITPMGFRLNCSKKSKRRKKLINDYPPISSIISLPLDIFEGVKFHTEILCFNCPWLKPHYTYGEEITF
tara:strand:- start:7934 stop:8515 length:582 start_codon:yes stop_codon:yes gene_type:complete